MAIICSFSCRFQIYRWFFFLFNNLGDNCGIYIMGYLDDFAILVQKVKVAYNL